MSDSMTHYAQLSQLSISDGAVVHSQTDRSDIALANAQAGLSGFSEMDTWLTEVDGGEYPIFAAPVVDPNVMDDTARLSLLCQELIPKLTAMALPPQLRLVLSGYWPESIVNSLQATLGLSTEHSIQALTLADTLTQWEAAHTDQVGPWLWLASHLGCGISMLSANRLQLACSARSEGIYSTDLITALRFEPSDQPKHLVAQAAEPANDNPLAMAPQALSAMTQSLAGAQSRPIIHGLPISAATDIELYRFRQLENSQPAERPLWPDSEAQNDIALSATVGTPGVCALPLAMLFQHHWNDNQPPLCIAHEGMQRFTWSPLVS